MSKLKVIVNDICKKNDFEQQFGQKGDIWYFFKKKNVSINLYLIRLIDSLTDKSTLRPHDFDLLTEYLTYYEQLLLHYHIIQDSNSNSNQSHFYNLVKCITFIIEKKQDIDDLPKAYLTEANINFENAIIDLDANDESSNLVSDRQIIQSSIQNYQVNQVKNEINSSTQTNSNLQLGINKQNIEDTTLLDKPKIDASINNLKKNIRNSTVLFRCGTNISLKGFQLQQYTEQQLYQDVQESQFKEFKYFNLFKDIQYSCQLDILIQKNLFKSFILHKDQTESIKGKTFINKIIVLEGNDMSDSVRILIHKYSDMSSKCLFGQFKICDFIILDIINQSLNLSFDEQVNLNNLSNELRQINAQMHQFNQIHDKFTQVQNESITHAVDIIPSRIWYQSKNQMKEKHKNYEKICQWKKNQQEFNKQIISENILKMNPSDINGNIQLENNFNSQQIHIYNLNINKVNNFEKTINKTFIKDNNDKFNTLSQISNNFKNINIPVNETLVSELKTKLTDRENQQNNVYEQNLKLNQKYKELNNNYKELKLLNSAKEAQISELKNLNLNQNKLESDYRVMKNKFEEANAQLKVEKDSKSLLLKDQNELIRNNQLNAKMSSQNINSQEDSTSIVKKNIVDSSLVKIIEKEIKRTKDSNKKTSIEITNAQNNVMMCVYCKSNEKSKIAFPCMHLLFCDNCSNKNIKVCQICNRNIDKMEQFKQNNK